MLSGESSTHSNIMDGPILILPNEIISSIFTMSRGPYGIERPSRFEIQLALVCRRWRDVAFETASLWTDITFYRRTSSLQLMLRYLSRSKGHPIDVSIYLLGNLPDISFLDDEEKAGAIVNAIVPHAMRWRTLLVRTQYKTTGYKIIRSLKPLEVSTLQSLTFESCPLLPETNEMLENPIFDGGAPSLTHVRMRPLFNSWPPPNAIVTLDLCKMPLETYSIDFQRFSHILTSSPQLAHLSLGGDFIGVETFPPNSTRSIQLPALKALRIHNVNGDTVPAILAAIDAPYLEYLWLETYEEVNFSNGVAQSAKFPTVRFLTLKHVPVHTELLFVYSEAFPNVSHLHIDDSSTEIHSALGVASVDSQARFIHPFPKLQTIAFTTLTTNLKRYLIPLDLMLSARARNGAAISLLLLEELMIVEARSRSLREPHQMGLLTYESYPDLWMIIDHDSKSSLSF